MRTFIYVTPKPQTAQRSISSQVLVYRQTRKRKIWKRRGKCVMTLGVLSWTMAQIQNHKSWLQKTRTATSPDTFWVFSKMCSRCAWALGILSWCIVEIHGNSKFLTHTHSWCLGQGPVESANTLVSPWETTTKKCNIVFAECRYQLSMARKTNKLECV